MQVIHCMGFQVLQGAIRAGASFQNLKNVTSGILVTNELLGGSWNLSTKAISRIGGYK